MLIHTTRVISAQDRNLTRFIFFRLKQNHSADRKFVFCLHLAHKKPISGRPERADLCYIKNHNKNDNSGMKYTTFKRWLHLDKLYFPFRIIASTHMRLIKYQEFELMWCVELVLVFHWISHSACCCRAVFEPQASGFIDFYLANVSHASNFIKGRSNRRNFLLPCNNDVWILKHHPKTNRWHLAKRQKSINFMFREKTNILWKGI